MRRNAYSSILLVFCFLPLLEAQIQPSQFSGRPRIRFAAITKTDAQKSSMYRFCSSTRQPAAVPMETGRSPVLSGVATCESVEYGEGIGSAPESPYSRFQTTSPQLKNNAKLLATGRRRGYSSVGKGPAEGVSDRLCQPAKIKKKSLRHYEFLEAAHLT